MNKIVPSGESVTLTTDGANVTCLNGEKGEPGAQGEMGPKGEKGESSINPYNVWGKNHFDRKIVSKLIKISYKINLFYSVIQKNCMINYCMMSQNYKNKRTHVEHFFITVI